MKKLYFDLETNGLSRFWAQILSGFFAKEDYDESNQESFLDITCSMELSRLPEPEALVVNGIPLDQLAEDNSLHSSIHEVIGFIQQNTPSIFVAHNADFDSSFITNAIYQNVASTNMYPFKNDGNILLDSLKLVRALYAFDPSCGVKIPIDAKGFPVFKLERLCKANSITIDAHKAKNDVLALKQLVELIEKKSPTTYNNSILSSVKKTVRQKIVDSPYFFAAVGTEKNYGVRALAPIAFSEDGSSCVVVDLLADLEKIKNYSPLELTGFLGTRVHKKYPVFLLPLNKGHVVFAPNEIDFIFEFTYDFDHKSLFRKASETRRDNDLSQAAREALSWRENSFGAEDPEVEERIYGSFPSVSEKSFIRAFNLAEVEDKWSLIESFSDRLKDDRFLRLARRVVLQNWPEYCTEEHREHYYEWCFKRLFSEPQTQEDVPKWPTLFTCLSNFPKLKRKYPDKLGRISELEDFYKRLAARAGVDTSSSFDN